MDTAEFEQFVSAAGHDLQEPLRTVTSFTQLLSREVKGRVSPEADQYLAFILEGTARMRAMVEGLAALSRIGLSPVLGPVDLTKIVAWCARDTPGTVEVGELPEVQGDVGLLTLLFEHLFSNAVRFRKPDVDLRVDISAMRVNDAWQFCVRDNGMGFDSARVSSLFVPFRRLHGREISGAGMGLAICRRIVEQHGGSIWAEGAEGEGAAIWFTLS